MSDTAGSPSLIDRAIAWALSLKPVRAFLLYTEHRGPMLADSVTYRTLFSVFAGVLLGFSIAALWLSDNPLAWRSLVDAVETAIPGISDIVDFDSIRAPAGLTLTSIISLVALVGAAIGAIGSLRTALHTLADRVHDDLFWLWVIARNLLIAIAIGGGLALSAVATFYGTAAIGALKEWIGVGPDALADWATRGLSLLIVLALDTVLIALLFRMLSGVRAPAGALWPGALLGGIGLTVLQQLSGLIVGGAASNPLLASFASLIALLLWFNLSAQVILIASAYIITGVDERHDRVRARHGAPTFAQRRVLRGEDAVRVATEELRLAQRDVEAARAKAASKSMSKGGGS